MTTKTKVINLRKQGKSYGQIQTILGKKIAKSTLSYWCRNIKLPMTYQKQVIKLMAAGARKGRATALITNKIKQEEANKKLIKQLKPLSQTVHHHDTALIALAMLCLGEAFKYNSRNRQFFLGSSDPKIIQLFLGLIKQCFPFDIEKVRCTVQCRADQDTIALEKYWQKITQIPPRLFYKTRIDPRTQGRPTLKKDYMGVLRVDYFNSQVPKTLHVLYNSLAETVWKHNFPDMGR